MQRVHDGGVEEGVSTLCLLVMSAFPSTIGCEGQAVLLAVHGRAVCTRGHNDEATQVRCGTR